jgi:drug/metabolite transporter (DMT)-like permease
VRGAQVFVTIVLSYFIFHIEMVTMEYIGMGMILVGMLFTVWGNYQEQQSERQGYQILSVNDAYKD